MKIKKLYTYKSEQQIWRILLTDFNWFVVETRDVDSREVFFNCVDIETGKPLFKDFQFDEKSWIGIETIHKDVIFFHKYGKPDMPRHKEIICFEMSTQKILWRNEFLTYLFVYNNQVVASVENFEGMHFYALDYRTGEVVADYGENALQINQLRNLADEEKDYSLYKFPDRLTKDLIRQIEGDTVIKDVVLNLDISGDVEYTSYNDLFLMNYHRRIKGGILKNQFTAIDLEKNKIIFEEILNPETEKIIPDCFFVYSNILFLLKEKNQIIICRIE